LGHGAPPQTALEALVSFIQRTLEGASVPGSAYRSDGADGQSPVIALVLTGELLRQWSFRQHIWCADNAARNDDTITSLLLRIVRSSDSSSATASRGALRAGEGPSASERPQMQYQALFCLWVMTFDEDAAAGLDEVFGAAPILARAAQAALKFKLVRLIIAIFRNMLEANENLNAQRLLGAKVLPLCETLQERRYPDKELEDDLVWVVGVLSRRLEQMSSYDQFASELYSGQLSFDSPVHLLDEFWKENAEKLTEHDNKDLKQLVHLVKPDTDSDATTLAVACADIGKFVQFADGARRRLDALGAKAAIMDLVNYDNSNVKHQALQTLARLVSTSWR